MTLFCFLLPPPPMAPHVLSSSVWDGDHCWPVHSVCDDWNVRVSLGAWGWRLFADHFAGMRLTTPHVSVVFSLVVRV